MALSRSSAPSISSGLIACSKLPMLSCSNRGSGSATPNPGATTNRLFTTRYLWQEEPVIRDFMYQSGIAGIVGDLMGTSSMRFYFDHTLVKEPGTDAPTPWHQDIPYWPFLGRQIGSAWVALSSTSVAESSLEFVRGSHRWGAYYAPESFDGSKNWTDDFQGERVPDIEAARDEYDIVGWDVEPGDAIVFSAWILHGAPGNAGPNRRAAFSNPLAGRRQHLGAASRMRPDDHPGRCGGRTRCLPGRRPRFPSRVVANLISAPQRADGSLAYAIRPCRRHGCCAP